MAQQVEELAGAAWPVAKSFLVLCVFLAAGFALRSIGNGWLTNLHATWAGGGVIVLAGAALTAAGLPRQAVAFAGGYVFGAAAGGVMSLAAQILGCALDFYGARLAGRRLAARLLRGRLAGLPVFLARHPFSAVLTLRLLPVGNNVALNVLAGATGVPARPFLFASALGYVPQTVIFALAGSGVQVARRTELAVAAILFGLSALSGGFLLIKTARLRTAPPNR